MTRSETLAHRSRHRPDPWLVITVTAAFAVFATYAVLRQQTFLTAGYDLGIFDQAVQGYARLGPPVVPLKGLDYNLLGDHFHPVLALLAPLYWVWSDPRMLLIAQAGLLAGSAIPVFRVTRRRFERTPALLVAVGYLLCWPLQGMVDFDVHEVAFAVPVLAFLLDALDRRSYGWVVGLSAALLLVREDMGAIVVMVAVVVAFRREWVPAVVLGVLGIVGFVATTAWIIPAFASSGTFAYWTYDALGPDARSAALHLLREPLDSLRLFVTPVEKVTTLLWTFGATTLFLALGSPYVLLALPILAERFFSSREALWTTEFHYTGVLAPVLFIGAVDTLGRIVRRWHVDRRWVTAYAAVLVAVPLVGSLVLQAQFPLGRLVTGEAFSQTPRSESLARLLPLVPDGVCVAADDRAVPQLTHRTYVTNPDIPSPPVTWVVLDMDQEQTGYLGPTPQDYLARSLAAGFEVVARDGPIVLLHHDGPVDPRCAAWPD